MVLAARAAMIIIPENTVMYRVPLRANIATSLTNHLAHCARRTFTVIVVSIPAFRDVNHKTKAKPAIKAVALVILVVKRDSGVISVTNSVGRVAVVMCATEQQVTALAIVLRHTLVRCVITSAVTTVSIQRGDLAMKLTGIASMDAKLGGLENSVMASVVRTVRRRYVIETMPLAPTGVLMGILDLCVVKPYKQMILIQQQ